MGQVNILSLDGGGIRGLLTAQLLSRILSARPSFLDNTYVMAGTSTGGIIALGLAYGLPIDEIVSLYSTDAKKIFSRSLLGSVWRLGGLNGAEYSNTNLKKLLESKFTRNAKLGSLSRKVFIPTFKLYHEDAVKGSKYGDHPTWRAKYFHNFGGTSNDDNRERIVDIAMRTSAAPTYFPTYDGYIDGGVVFNNPILPAMAQVMRSDGCGVSLSDVRVLSVGTGINPEYIKVTRSGPQKNWGAVSWVKPLVNLLIDSNMESSLFIAQQLVPDSSQIYRCCPIFDKKIPMDTVKGSDLSYLISLADSYYLDIQSELLSWVDKFWLPKSL